MVFLNIFFLAVVLAQETTTQANDETTTVETEKNNGCKLVYDITNHHVAHNLSNVGFNIDCTGNCYRYGLCC